MNIPVMAATGGLLGPLYTAFGWFMGFLYHLTANYGLAIILFTIAIRMVLIPFNVRQHKTTLKQQALSRDMTELARIYGDDRVGLQQAQAELMKKHGISTSAGCLMSLLQLFLIWPVFRIISAPLQYIAGVSADHLLKLGELLQSKHLLTAAQAQMASTQNVPLMTALQDNPAVFSEAVNAGFIRADQMINLNFLGLNLGLKPTWRPAQLFGEQMSTYLPLLLIPLLAVLSSILMSKIQEWTNPMYWRQKEEKALAKENPARSVTAESQMAGMTKGMRWMMPLMTLWTVFIMPAAMGLYWIAGNLVMIGQQLLLYYLYTKPTFAEARAGTVTNADLKRQKQKAKSK